MDVADQYIDDLRHRRKSSPPMEPRDVEALSWSMVDGFASGISDRCVPRRANLTVATKADRSEEKVRERERENTSVQRAWRMREESKRREEREGEMQEGGGGRRTESGIKSHPLPTP